MGGFRSQECLCETPAAEESPSAVCHLQIVSIGKASVVAAEKAGLAGVTEASPLLLSAPSRARQSGRCGAVPGHLRLDREQMVTYYSATGSSGALITKYFLESLAIFSGSWGLQVDQCEEISSPLLTRARHLPSRARDADQCRAQGFQCL